MDLARLYWECSLCTGVVTGMLLLVRVFLEAMQLAIRSCRTEAFHGRLGPRREDGAPYLTELHPTPSLPATQVSSGVVQFSVVPWAVPAPHGVPVYRRPLEHSCGVQEEGAGQTGLGNSMYGRFHSRSVCK